MMRWSILIASIASRYPKPAGTLIERLQWLASPYDIEILALVDNRACMEVGEKRNRLLDMARGDYISFVDDDDTVSDVYCRRIMAEIPRGADVICFGQQCTHVHEHLIENCRYSLGYKYEVTPWENGIRQWRGLPAHTMVWRREIAVRGRFPDQNFREDVAWVQQVAKHAELEIQIPDTLYFYNFDSQRTATRG